MITPELSEYRAQMITLGFDDQRIEDELRRVGWREEDVRELFRSPIVHTNTPASKQEYLQDSERKYAERQRMSPETRITTERKTEISAKPEKRPKQNTVPHEKGVAEQSNISSGTHPLSQKSDRVEAAPQTTIIQKRTHFSLFALTGYSLVAIAGIAFGYFLVFDFVEQNGVQGEVTEIEQEVAEVAVVVEDLRSQIVSRFDEQLGSRESQTIQWSLVSDLTPRATSTVRAGNIEDAELGVAMTLPDIFNRYNLEKRDEKTSEDSDGERSRLIVEIFVDATETKWAESEFSMFTITGYDPDAFRDFEWELRDDNTLFDNRIGREEGVLLGNSKEYTFTISRSMNICPEEYQDIKRVNEITRHCALYDVGPELIARSFKVWDEFSASSTDMVDSANGLNTE